MSEIETVFSYPTLAIQARDGKIERTSERSDRSEPNSVSVVTEFENGRGGGT